MKKLVVAAFSLVSVVVGTAPVFAQDAKAPSSMEIEMDRRKRAAEDADRGYRVIIKNTTPEKAAKTDPWANARETPTATDSKKK